MVICLLTEQKFTTSPSCLQCQHQPRPPLSAALSPPDNWTCLHPEESLPEGHNEKAERSVWHHLWVPRSAFSAVTIEHNKLFMKYIYGKHNYEWIWKSSSFPGSRIGLWLAQLSCQKINFVMSLWEVYTECGSWGRSLAETEDVVEQIGPSIDVHAIWETGRNTRVWLSPVGWLGRIIILDSCLLRRMLVMLDLPLSCAHCLLLAMLWMLHMLLRLPCYTCMDASRGGSTWCVWW